MSRAAIKEPLDFPQEKQTDDVALAWDGCALCTGIRPAVESEPPGGGGIAVGIPVMVSMERGTMPPPAAVIGGIADGTGVDVGGDLRTPLGTGAVLTGGVFCLS